MADSEVLLALHERLAAVEQALDGLRPRAVDPRARLLALDVPCRAAFLRFSADPDPDPDAGEQALAAPDLAALYALVAGLLRRVLPPSGLAPGQEVSALACAHWSREAGARVVECLLRCEAPVLRPSALANAALDAGDARQGRARPRAWAEVSRVHSPEWFEAALREAGGAAGSPRWTVGAAGRACLDALPPRQRDAAWESLHGWLASEFETALPRHPRALDASRCACRLLEFLDETGLGDTSP